MTKFKSLKKEEHTKCTILTQNLTTLSACYNSVVKRLFFHPTKNKKKKTEVFELLLVLHITSVLTLREPHILRIFEENLPRRIFRYSKSRAEEVAS